MEPEFKSYPAFKAIGISYKGNNAGGEIPQLWDKFVPRMKEIQNAAGNPAYGVCRPFEGAQNGEFEYIAAQGVNNVDNIPEGMIPVIIPAHEKYAVFTHKGPISKIQETVKYAFGEWLQTGEYAHAQAPDFELYNEKFKGESEDSEMYIYIPVQ